MGNTLYKMRGVDSGTGDYVIWDAEGNPDHYARQAPAPVGSYSDIVVLRTVPLVTEADTVLYRWNGTDTSQLTQVRGNGIGGAGSPGDWTLTATTWPNDDAPALAITNVTSVGGAYPGSDALWLFDYEGPLPSRYQVTFRKSFLSASPAFDLGVVVYYLDPDHYITVVPGAVTDLYLAGRNGVSADFAGQSIGNVYSSSAERDVVYGSFYAATCWYRRARQSFGPSITAKMGGTFTPTYAGAGAIAKRSRIAAIQEAGTVASWGIQNDYTPRIGLWARGFSSAGTDYISGITFYQSDGGL